MLTIMFMKTKTLVSLKTPFKLHIVQYLNCKWKCECFVNSVFPKHKEELIVISMSRTHVYKNLSLNCLLIFNSHFINNK